MNLNDIRGGAAFQVQTSRDGVTWEPRQPHPKGLGTLVPGGDFWFTDHGTAWAAVNNAGDSLRWLAVRVVVRDRRGNVVGEVPFV
ncbi:MAG TPA: hypothetical protein VIP77_22655 [Jiangellaceae bacterium]